MEIVWIIIVIAVAIFAIPFFAYLIAMAMFGEDWLKELLGYEDPQNDINKTTEKEEKQ